MKCPYLVRSTGVCEGDVVELDISPQRFQVELFPAGNGRVAFHADQLSGEKKKTWITYEIYK